MKKKNFGVVQLPLLIGLIIVAAALPIVSKLTQQSQDTRNRAAENLNLPTPTCNPRGCDKEFGCTKNRCLPGDAIESNCTCPAISVDSPNWRSDVNVNCDICLIGITPTLTPTPTLVPTKAPYNCTPTDSNVTVKAFKADGTTEVAFGYSDGQLVIDERFGNENKVIFEVSIANKSGIKNVGLQFGDAKAFAKYDGTKWNGTVEGSGVGFYAQPIVSGNVYRFPLQVNFAKDTNIEVKVQYD